MIRFGGRYRRGVDLVHRVSSCQGDFVLYAITPPRQSTPAERLPEIAKATIERLARLDIDGLVLYDIDDESSRNPAERPFPFSPTVDPSEYRAHYLQAWRRPVIVYRAVGKYRREDLRNWISEQDPLRTLTVMVGAASSGVAPAVSLARAQAMGADLNPDLLLGGVAIPERHSRRENEHLRLIAKQPNFTGEIIEEMRRLRESDVIRLVDALAVQKNTDGTLVALQWSDLSVPEAEDLGATIGALLGLGLAGEEGMNAGAEAGAAAGADGHIIDDAEVWDLAMCSSRAVPPPSR